MVVLAAVLPVVVDERGDAVEDVPAMLLRFLRMRSHLPRLAQHKRLMRHKDQGPRVAQHKCSLFPLLLFYPYNLFWFC